MYLLIAMSCVNFFDFNNLLAFCFRHYINLFDSLGMPKSFEWKEIKTSLRSEKMMWTS